VLHVLTLFAVQADTVSPFVRYIRGDWHNLSRRVAPALIATDLLEQHPATGHSLLSPSARLFIALDFWATPEAYRRACRSPECQDLLLERRMLANSCFEFGAFEFAHISDSFDGTTRDVISN
jgi:hypothetical protein